MWKVIAPVAPYVEDKSFELAPKSMKMVVHAGMACSRGGKARGRTSTHTSISFQSQIYTSQGQ
eukprot:181022-Prorocentrum_lima.AAC.1